VSESEVIIVGAGPVGLALSLALARYHVPSVVLESGNGETIPRAARSCVLRPDTAAWLLSGESAASGARGDPQAESTRWARWRALRREQLVEDVELSPQSSPVHMEQHALERQLREALEREQLARLITGSHLDVLEQDAEGITAHTRPRNTPPNGRKPASGHGSSHGHGSSPGHRSSRDHEGPHGHERSHDHGSGTQGPYGNAHERDDGRGGGVWWRGSYLVGCDGARSTVRKLLGVSFAGRTAVERHAVAALRTRLPWEGEALLHADLGGRPGEVVARPLPDGVWRLDWLLPPRGELVTPEQLLDRVHETLTLWYGRGGAKRPHPGNGSTGYDAGGTNGHDAMGPYELLDTGVHLAHQRLARHWRVRRAFLAGDAAHLVGALGIQSVDEGMRDVANLAWKLALAWHEASGARGPRQGRDATETLLNSYESERRGAVRARLRAVDQALPLVRKDGGGLRGILPGRGGRARLELLTDGHLGRGPLGAPAAYERSPLAPERGALEAAPVDTAPGAPVQDVPVIALDGTRGRLRDQLGGVGGEMLALLIAPGTGVWDSKHWMSAGLMPELAAAVEALPLRAGLLVTEDYPGAAAHTVLVIRPDGHLVAALPAARTSGLRACADAVRGGAALPGAR
jgi:3-(3-hydroxy-phenyl)propionate hydroxylase